MRTIPNLRSMHKRERERILFENPGILSRVARELGVTRQTVSRVFNGKIDRSPAVAAALEEALKEIESKRSAA
jgi:transcriptional regulator with XRE-family HTH domain